jgi:broad specificity phosphatase PhoE
MSLLDIPDVTVVLIPHCASVPKAGWTGDHAPRPLSDTGREQARRLVPLVGDGIDAIYSSPARRCLETVEPLAAATGLPVEEIAEFYETGDFREPVAWVDGLYAPMGQAVSGAWVAGRAMAALLRVSRAHPDGRIVVCSHGDVIPVLVAQLAGAFGIPVPPPINRGEWYRLHVAGGHLEVSTHP